MTSWDRIDRKKRIADMLPRHISDRVVFFDITETTLSVRIWNAPIWGNAFALKKYADLRLPLDLTDEQIVARILLVS
jgi:hypothetical protein